MRMYINPCFMRFSLDKIERKMSRSEQCSTATDSGESKCQDCSEPQYRTPIGQSKTGNDPNGNVAKSTSDRRALARSKTLSRGDAFDIVDVFEPEDGLSLEYRKERRNAGKRKRNRLYVCVLVFLVALLISGAVIAYVTVHSRRPRSLRCLTPNCLSTDKDGQNIEDETLPDTADTRTDDKSKNRSTVCTTPHCQEISQRVRLSMNFSVDPCQDFHQFACGLWSWHNPIPASMPKWDTMAKLNEQKDSDLRMIIEKDLVGKKDLPWNGFKNKIKQFYKSCVDLQAIEERGREPLLQFISKLGSWSPVKMWSSSATDLTTLLARSHQLFTASVYDDRIKSPLFKSSVRVNDIDSSRHIIEINVPDFPINDRNIYLDQIEGSKEIRDKYKLLFTNYVALLGPTADAELAMEAVLKFEEDLANVSASSTSIRNPTQVYSLRTVDEFAKSLTSSKIDWLRFFREMFKPVDIEISASREIGIRSPNYFQGMMELLERTPFRVITDYIIWVCVWKFGPYASAPFREAHYNFQKSMTGIQQRPLRWRTCIEDIEQTMEFGLASLYVERALKKEDKILATEMLSDITKEFKRNLVNVEWMDVATKAQAFEKLDSIVGNIGYPEFVRNETYLDILHEGIKMSEKKYFENSVNMYKWKKNTNLLALNSAVDRTAYDLPPTLVEAYFDPNKNKMVFLAGIMHPPFYDPIGPMALNYGALGLVVGHEVTHAFDDLGRLFDVHGEKKDWWSEKSTLAFNKRSECMKQQYGNYTIHGMNVDGQLTLGENIADNGGIKVAYNAYKEWEMTNGVEQTLPDINLTMDQLLFVSHAQVWCGNYREEFQKESLKVNYHSPGRYRIIGPLSNLKAFADAFECPLGSPMNPVHKCHVW